MLAPSNPAPSAMTKIVCGDALSTLRQMHDNSVHCIVTSPPYFGLRDYGQPGQIGLEASPQEFVAKLVEIFREVRRVLREDGTCWLNLGDSYARAPTKGGSGPGGKNEDRWGYGAANKQRVKNPDSKQATNRSADLDGIPRHTTVGSSDGAVGRADRPGTRAAVDGLDAKQLLGIPWRVAFALQADGWYLRQDIIWHKPNPMPESVRDRCTKAHEYLFLLTKSDKYFFDADAIAEPTAYPPGGSHDDVKQGGFDDKGPIPGSGQRSFRAIRSTRNKRSVWTIAPKPYKEAHFATFPPDLVEPCIAAGTSEHGCCPNCATPWARVIDRKAMVIDRSGRTHEKGRTRTSGTMVEPASSTTLGFYPQCDCIDAPPLPKYPDEPDAGHDSDIILWKRECEAVAAERQRLVEIASTYPIQPGVVMDIFGGAGTTGLVAKQLNRHCVLIELNPDYVKLIEKRIATLDLRNTSD